MFDTGANNLHNSSSSVQLKMNHMVTGSGMATLFLLKGQISVIQCSG